MKTSFIFQEDQALILELVSLIRYGDIVSGLIEAPVALISNGEAVGHTGFKIGLSSVVPLITTIHPPGEERPINHQERNKREREGFMSIFLDRKLPGFVRFEDAGYRDGLLNFDGIIEIGRHFLGLGYRGMLHCYKGGLESDRESWRTDASISLFLGGLRSCASTNCRVSATWDAKPRVGAREFVDPVIEFCKQRGLEQ